MSLEEDYSSDGDKSEEWTAESSDDDDNNYQEVVEQPRKHSQGTIEFLERTQTWHILIMILVALYYSLALQ